MGRFRAPWAFWQKPCFGREGPCCIRAIPRHLPWHYPVNPVITSEDFLLCISGRNLRGKIHARSCSGSSANPSKVWLHPDPPFPRNSPLQELVSLGLPIPPGGYFTSKPTPKAGQGTHPQPHARGPTQGTSRRGPLLWGNCAPCVLYPRCLHPRVVPGSLLGAVRMWGQRRAQQPHRRSWSRGWSRLGSAGKSPLQSAQINRCCWLHATCPVGPPKNCGGPYGTRPGSGHLLTQLGHRCPAPRS